MTPNPRPVQIPCDRKICQYSVARLVVNVPRTTKEDPPTTVDRMYPASASLPDMVHIEKARKVWTDPIQEI